MRTAFRITIMALWMISGAMLTFAMMIWDLRGINETVWDITKWVFLLSFVTFTPLIFSAAFINTMFLTEKGIRDLHMRLLNKVYEYKNAKTEYQKATEKCIKDVQELKDYLKQPSKGQVIADIDELFNNTPLDPEMTKVREKVLEYLSNSV